MFFIEGWINLVYKIATGNWKTKLLISPIVGALYLSLIVSCIVLSFIVDRWLILPKVARQPFSFVIGLCLIAFGFYLMMLSTLYFLRAHGTPVPLSPPPKLITTGPYRFSRNPMLTGIFVQFFGLGIAIGSPSLLFLFTPLFIALNVWILKKIEEPELERRLGEDYVQYKKQVPMFFPRMTKR